MLWYSYGNLANDQILPHILCYPNVRCRCISITSVRCFSVFFLPCFAFVVCGANNMQFANHYAYALHVTILWNRTSHCQSLCQTTWIQLYLSLYIVCIAILTPLLLFVINSFFLWHRYNQTTIENIYHHITVHIARAWLRCERKRDEQIDIVKKNTFHRCDLSHDIAMQKLQRCIQETFLSPSRRMGKKN